MFRYLRILALLLMVAIASVVSSQDCSSRNVIVNAADSRGVPITNLATADFRASYRGHPLNISSAGFRHDPSVRTVLLLDMDESMHGVGAEGINKWKIARTSALEFISAAPPQARISLSTFSSSVGRAFKSEGGRQAMEDWLNSAELAGTSSLKGKAAIYRALSETIQDMGAIQPGDSIYIVTDGYDYTQASEASRAASELQSNGIRLFAFLLNDLVNASNGLPPTGGLPVNPSGGGVQPPPIIPQQLADVVRASGGMGLIWYPGGRRSNSWSIQGYDYDDTTQEAIRTAARTIAQAITTFYILTVSPPAGSHGLGDWKLEIVDTQGKKRKDVILAYPSKLSGCGGTISGPK